ncbi:MAG: hypothetical protein JO345_37220 [Streptosporangiaceae bacterium]|nr:hypothetical protein [Streptosporangiaceae bacterium]
MNMIEASGLGKRYGSTWALRDCTLAIPAGHVVPVDRGRLAARPVPAAHRRHRLAGPPPRRLIRPAYGAEPPSGVVSPRSASISTRSAMA